MINSKHKFIIKLKTLLFFCCALILSLTIAANIILALYKNKITQALNSCFFKPVAIKNMFYLPPNFIILGELAIFESKIKADKKVFQIPITCAAFSLSNLFLSKGIYISSLYCIGFATNLSDLVMFFKDNPTKILDFIMHLPKQDFTLRAKQVTIESSGKNKCPIKAKGNFNLKVRDKIISAYGSVGRNMFDFSGMLEQEQLVVENFKLNGENINCQFQGRLSSDLAEFKGFILTGYLNSVKKLSNPDIFILDIDSRIQFAFPRVEIKRLNFSINNNPVKITANMLFNQPFNCNLKLFSDFRGMDCRKRGTLKNTSLIASITTQEDKTIVLNCTLNIDFPEQKKESLPLEKVELNVENLVFNPEKPSALEITAAGLNLFFKTSTNTYNINLKDFGSKIYELDNTLKQVKFSSKFYDGRLWGKGYIKIHKFIPVITAVIRTDNVATDKLGGILIHFSKINGKLSSQMSFINYPQLIFKGTLHVHDGSLNNFEFFKWVANSFDLPSLKKIHFSSASTNFIVNQEGAGMYNMNLDSENVKIKGYFKLREKDMVSSKISFSLRRELLQKSIKFTPLLKLLDTKQELVRFNFQLSGNLHGMNFQWLKSDFKEELQRSIPNFAKRNFEEQVVTIIESINKE